MTNAKVYLDNAAATPIFPEVVKAMETVMTGVFGNPSSLHSFGQKAAEVIDTASKQIGEFLNCQTSEIIFTGSGTESNNLAVIGVAKANKLRGNHIITTAIEHPSILNACRALEKEGFEITYLPVEPSGQINVEALERAVTKKTILVATHLANSEIGVIQPIERISKVTKARGIILHVDACQATAYIDLDVEKLGADLLAINGSKAYAPRGVAVLYVRNGVEIFPIHYGGGQQQGLRSGTENLPGIVGLARALEIIKLKRQVESNRLANLTEKLGTALEHLGAKVNVKHSSKLPNHLSAVMPLNESNLVKYFDNKGIAVSSGSACSSRTIGDSHVLKAIGLNPTEINRTIRISLGYRTTIKDIQALISGV